MGNWVQQTVNGVTTTYVLDLNAGLTQVLSDGTDTYLYGLGRIGEESATWDYYLGDALGLVRQLTDDSGAVSLAQTYQPYGELMSAYGDGGSSYSFTGEALDASGLIFLRARYMDPGLGRFINRDTWEGIYEDPLSLNRWMYVQGNPVNYTDPSGLLPCPGAYWDNSCTIEDYLAVFFAPLFEMFGAPSNLSGLRLRTGTLDVSFPGAVTKEYLKGVYYYSLVMNGVADFGLSAFPGGGLGYDMYNAISGENPLSGYVYSPSERYLALAFTVTSYDEIGKLFCRTPITGKADEVFALAVSEGLLDPKFKASAVGFTDEVKLINLKEDIVVLQYSSTGDLKSPWFTTRQYVKPGNAQRYLALPSSNTANSVSKFVIPAGTDIILGKVSSQTDDLITFGEHAVGGGYQIYVLDYSKIVRLDP